MLASSADISLCCKRLPIHRPRQLPTWCWGIFELYDTIAMFGIWDHVTRHTVEAATRPGHRLVARHQGPSEPVKPTQQVAKKYPDHGTDAMWASTRILGPVSHLMIVSVPGVDRWPFYRPQMGPNQGFRMSGGLLNRGSYQPFCVAFLVWSQAAAFEAA